MSQLSANKATRDTAIPFRANWFDSALRGSVFGSEFGLTTGDLRNIATREATSNGTNLIRFVRPYKGDLTEAYLTIQATVPVTSPTTLRLFMGRFLSDGVTATYNTADIPIHHKIITGRDSEISYGSQATIFLEGLNLLPLIPKRGDANYNPDGWVLGVELVMKGDPTNASTGWFLYMFKVDCSVQLAELKDD